MTDPTTAPSSAPDSPPQFATPLPEPFEVSFDYNDESHCSWGIDGAIEELDEALKARLGDDIRSLDDDPARDRIQKAVTQLEAERDDLEEQRDDLEDPDPRDEVALAAATATAAALDAAIETAEKHIDALNEAAARLTYCEGGCVCGSDAWEGLEENWVNEMLDSLESRVWSVREERWRGPDYTEDDIEAFLDMDRITPDAASQRGWSEFRAKWDGTALTVTFTYDRGHNERLFTPLNDAQAKLREAWLERCWCDEDVASTLLTLDPAVVTTALELWDAMPDAGSRISMADLVRAVTAATEPPNPAPRSHASSLDGPDAASGATRTDLLATFDAATRHVLGALASDWAGSLTDLLDVARSVTGTTGTIPAAARESTNAAAAVTHVSAFELSHAA